MKTPKAFRGTWRIVETEMWKQDDLDLVVPAHITFDEDGVGGFQLVAVNGETDCRFEGQRVEFSWHGDDDGEDANGRGWAEITKDGLLAGMIYFHLGNESSFLAKRAR